MENPYQHEIEQLRIEIWEMLHRYSLDKQIKILTLIKELIEDGEFEL